MPSLKGHEQNPVHHMPAFFYTFKEGMDLPFQGVSICIFIKIYGIPWNVRMSVMTAPKEIPGLVEQFKRNPGEYKSGKNSFSVMLFPGVDS